METMSLKLDEGFACEINKVMREHHYTTKTEFVREAIRDKIKRLQKEELLRNIDLSAGSLKRKTTDATLCKIREQIAREL